MNEKTPIFAVKKSLNTMPKRNIFLVLSSHLLFCATVFLVFGNFCRLRPAAYHCMYKEYLSGVIVLASYYMILFLWFPVCFRKNQTALFTILSLLTILLASAGEILMVYPQINYILSTQFGPDKAHLYIQNSFIFVFARNAGFALFAFMSGLIRYQSHLLWQNDRILFSRHRQVEAERDEINSYLVDVSDICYCEQNSNYTRIYTKNGEHYDKLCTLELMSVLLSETNIVRISRKHLVMPDAIVSYNRSSVNVYSGEGIPPVSLAIPRRRADEVLQRIHSHEAAKSQDESAMAAESSKSDKQNKKTVPNRQQARILKYVRQHPMCTAKDIRKHVRTTPNTIYRHIARLKQQGLIRHVGSNKTGGYRVVEGEMGNGK